MDFSLSFSVYITADLPFFTTPHASSIKSRQILVVFFSLLETITFLFFSWAWIHFLFHTASPSKCKTNVHYLSANTCRKHQETVMLYTFLGNVPSLNIKKQNPLSYLKGSYSITLVCSGSAAANTCLISRERGSAMSFSFLRMTPISATENLIKQNKT